MKPNTQPKITQKQAILEYIRTHGSITSMQAEDIGCRRLASRICDLKKDGYKIVDEWITVKTRWGNGKTEVKRYSLNG